MTFSLLELATRLRRYRTGVSRWSVTRHLPASPAHGGLSLPMDGERDSMEPHGESSGRDDRGAGGRVMTVAATPAAGLRNGPPQPAAPRHIGPCSSSTAPAPDIGAIMPHLGAVQVADRLQATRSLCRRLAPLSF